MNDRTDPTSSGTRDPAADSALEVSVIVPAYRGLATIGACLESVRIAALGHRCEVIVVESSGDGAADLVRDRFPEVRLIVSPIRLSAGAARSEGFRHARGRWLLAVDQDCVVPRDWITRLVELLGRPGVGAAGGSMAVANPGNLSGWCVYLLEFFTHFPSRGAVRDDNYLIGANSAWRADAIAGGAFPDQTLGEDLLATAEIRRCGFAVLYDPTLAVRHQNREGWGEFLRYCRKMGSAAAHSQTRIGRRSIGVLHHFPFLAFGIPLLMLPRIGLALVGSPPRYMAMFLALLPACAIGQLAWANRPLKNPFPARRFRHPNAGRREDVAMRGRPDRPQTFWYSIDVEDLIETDHPLRAIKRMVDEALKDMSRAFTAAYSTTGRPGVAPERLLKSLLLQSLYSIRSERELCRRLKTDLLFRWFLDMTPDEEVFVPTVFTHNRERLAEHGLTRRFFEGVVRQAIDAGLASDEHFTVDGSLIQSHAALKSLKRIAREDEDGNDDPTPPKGKGPGRKGRNESVDFRGERRTNATYRSSTDPEARLEFAGARSASGQRAVRASPSANMIFGVQPRSPRARLVSGKPIGAPSPGRAEEQAASGLRSCTPG